MLSVSSTKPQRFQPEQADGGIAPHFSGQQGNRLEKPETRPDPFFRARLIRVRNGSTVTEFVYDGLGRRVAEWDNGSLAKQWVWCGTELCEERNASNTVTKRFFPQGEQISGTAYFYSRDHLGSVREMTDASGTVHARYNYDPFGARSANTITTSAVESDFGFTGDYYNATVGLDLTLYRAYNPVLGRWINRDPIGEKGGLDLYAYVRDNPVDLTDFFGLCPSGQSADDAGACCCACDMQTVKFLFRPLKFSPFDSGHSQVMLPSGPSGFGPAGSGWQILYGPGVGPPYSDSPSETPRTAKSYKVCPSTLKKLQNSINMHSNDNYSLLNVFGNNCTGWACDRLSDAGLNPPVSNIWGLYPGNNFGQSPATKPMFYGK